MYKNVVKPYGDHDYQLCSIETLSQTQRAAFIKTVTTLRTIEGKEGALASAKAAGILGDAEGLAAHARAARIRIC